MAEKDARNVATVTLSDTKRDIKTLVEWWGHETRRTLLPGDKAQRAYAQDYKKNQQIIISV